MFLLAFMSTSFAFAQEGKQDPMELLDSERVIEPEDKLSYTLVEDREGARVLFVDENGEIDIPLVGSFVVAGKTCKEASYAIQEELTKNYYNKATVLLSFFKGSQTRGKIYLLGQVRNQGPLDIPSDEVLTLSKAILAAGGFTNHSDPTLVSIVRKDPDNPGQEIKKQVNMSEMLETGTLGDDPVLQPEDMVFVPQKGESQGKTLIVGEVRSPGLYPIPAGGSLTVTQAIFLAGGFTEFANRSNVKIVHANPDLSDEEKTTIVNVEDILEDGHRHLDVKIQNEDMIVVDEKWINF